MQTSRLICFHKPSTAHCFSPVYFSDGQLWFEACLCPFNQSCMVPALQRVMYFASFPCCTYLVLSCIFCALFPLPLYLQPAAHSDVILGSATSASLSTAVPEVNGLQEPSLAKRLRGTPERIELENYRLSLQREEELEEVPEETLAEHNLSSVLDKGTDADLGSR